MDNQRGDDHEFMRRQRSKAEQVYWLILAGNLLFILSASVYSANWLSPGAGESAGPVRPLWLKIDLSFRQLRDIATNVLLYMPLGALVAIVISFGPRLRLTHPAIFLGALLSIVIETVQAFVGRYSDPTDVVSNGIGHALGFLIMAIAILRFQLRPRSLLGLPERTAPVSFAQTLKGIRFVYVAVFVVVALVPLDFAIGVQDILSKLQGSGDGDPGLILDLLYHFRGGRFPIELILVTGLGFAPLALATSLIDRSEGRPGLARPVVHCALLALGTEGAQILIASGRSDILVIPLAAATALVIAALVNTLGARFSSLARTAPAQNLRLYLVLMMALYLGVIVTLAWSPFEFESPGGWKQKLLNDSNLVPFKLHFSARSLASALDIVRDVALYLPLGALLGQLLLSFDASPRWHVRAMAGAGFGLAVGLAVEASQTVVIGRYMDVTGALLAGAGCVTGCLVWMAISPRLETN